MEKETEGTATSIPNDEAVWVLNRLAQKVLELVQETIQFRKETTKVRSSSSGKNTPTPPVPVDPEKTDPAIPEVAEKKPTQTTKSPEPAPPNRAECQNFLVEVIRNQKRLSDVRFTEIKAEALFGTRESFAGLSSGEKLELFKKSGKRFTEFTDDEVFRTFSLVRDELIRAALPGGA